MLVCVQCVNNRLQNKDMSTGLAVQDAVDGARLAVVMADGKSLCAEHYHAHLESKIGEYVRQLTGAS